MVIIRLADDGPGLPAAVRTDLFGCAMAPLDCISSPQFWSSRCAGARRAKWRLAHSCSYRQRYNICADAAGFHPGRARKKSDRGVRERN
jgi:hypothetical protein